MKLPQLQRQVPGVQPWLKLGEQSQVWLPAVQPKAQEIVRLPMPHP